MTRAPGRRRFVATGLAALAAACASASRWTLAQPDNDLERLRSTGALKVAVYKEFFPFSDEEGRGIDVDLAQALSRQLGLRASLLPFDAGDSLNDDLRNMVWKGHYLGYGPADVMLHAPIDRVLAERNPQVRLLAPYHREALRLAIDTRRITDWQGLQVFARERIAVDGGSICAQLILSADGGRYREQVIASRGIRDAIDALQSGRAAGLMATRSELQAAGLDDAPFRIVEFSAPGLPLRGWAVGLAVRADRLQLAAALEQAMDELTRDGTLLAIFKAHRVAYAHP